MNFHTKDLQILGATEQYLSVRANLCTHCPMVRTERSLPWLCFSCPQVTMSLYKELLSTTGHSLSLSCIHLCRDQLKCDGRFRLSAKRTSLFKSAGASVQSTTGSRGVRLSGSNAGYTMFRGSVKSTGYPLHSPVSPFTSPPVRHRVPSHFSWSLPTITICNPRP